MSASDVVYVYGAFFAVMGICSLPMLGSLRKAGPKYRAVLIGQLAIGWGVAAVIAGWLTLGWFAIEAGGRWFGVYHDFTLVLMGAFFPLLFLGIRACNRTAAAAQTEDRGLTG